MQVYGQGRGVVCDPAFTLEKSLLRVQIEWLSWELSGAFPRLRSRAWQCSLFI